MCLERVIHHISSVYWPPRGEEQQRVRGFWQGKYDVHGLTGAMKSSGSSLYWLFRQLKVGWLYKLRTVAYSKKRTWISGGETPYLHYSWTCHLIRYILLWFSSSSPRPPLKNLYPKIFAQKPAWIITLTMSVHSLLVDNRNILDLQECNISTHRGERFPLGPPTRELEDRHSVFLCLFCQWICPALYIRDGEHCHYIMTLQT